MACLAAFAHAQDYYQVIDIPPTKAGALARSIPYALNSKNEVVGEADMASGQTRAFLFSGGVFKDLGALGGVWSRAFGINDAGQVVGAADLASNDEHAFLYAKGVMKDLGTLGGTESIAADINNLGVIVGQSDMVGQGQQAFIYKAGKMTSLGTLGGLYSHATSINDLGRVTGSSTTLVNSGVPTAFYYAGSGTIKSIGYITGGDSSSGQSIAANGSILGDGNRVAGISSSFAFVYANNVVQDLFADAGIQVSTARHMNRAGKIVGKTRRAGIGDRGYVTNTTGQPVDLTTLVDPTDGWTVQDAVSINDAGVIAAYAFKPGITFGHAVLLIPGQGPPVPLTGAATGITTTAATLHGEAIANGFDGQVWFQYGATASYGLKTVTQTLAGSARTPFAATLNNLKPHTTYHFRIATKNSKGITYGGDNTFLTANTSPVAKDDLFFVNSTRATAVNVLANDSDGDRDPLRFAYPFSGANDGIAKNIGANIIYTPGADFTGIDLLQYFIVDTGNGIANADAFVMNSNFDGLLTRNGADTGLVTVVMTGQGSFTAKVRLGVLTYSWVGALDGNRHFTRAIMPKGLPAATLDFQFDPETATIIGTVDNGLVHAFGLTNALTVAKVEGGRKLTALLAPPANVAQPQGSGYGTMAVAATGAITLAGKAGDGTAYTTAARLRADGTYNIMASLVYPGSKLGYLLGNLVFTDLPGSDSSGTLLWMKPATTGTYNPAAFETEVDFQAAFYNAQPLNTPALAFTPAAAVKLSGGDLAADIPHALSVSNRNVVTVTDVGADHIALTITATTGLLGGSFIHPRKPKVRTLLYGVIYQKQNLGARGVFAGTTTSGLVNLTP